MLREKDQGALFGNPKFPGVRNGLGFLKQGRPSLASDPSRHSEFHQDAVLSLTEFLRSRRLYFASLQPLALVFLSVIRGRAKPGGCCRGHGAGMQSVWWRPGA